jgi:polygalacturonase
MRIALSSCLALALACGGGSGGPDPTLSSDADLSSLTASAGTFAPAFSQGITTYTLTLPGGTDSLTVTPTAHDAKARKITVALGAATPVAVPSGTASPTMTAPAPGGRDTLRVVVTAEDGSTRTYTLTLVRGSSGTLSSDADLSSLSASVGPLAPAFSQGTTSYALDLPANTSALTVTPTAHDTKAKKITVALGTATPVEVASGTTSPSLAAPAPGDSATLSVVVTAEDGSTRTYTVVLTAYQPAEPTIPTECASATLSASYAVDATTGLPVFTPGTDGYDTQNIQNAINSCAGSLSAGQKRSVRLIANGAHTAFVSQPLTLKAGVTLWVDQGVTLFASRNPRDYDTTPGTATCAQDNNNSSGCVAFITVKGTSTTVLADAGIAGLGTIDGLGGEPVVGGVPTANQAGPAGLVGPVDSSGSWWDFANYMDAANRNFSNPRLIDVTRSSGFTLYQITLQNSPKFHVGLGSDAFMAWGVKIHTPSRTVNSVGRALSAAMARNTDGIDPYDANGGWILFSYISTGDDEVALKGGKVGCRNITIAHNHFGTGHGMSIGSETNAGRADGAGVGVDGLYVYDLSIDGQLVVVDPGQSNINGLRIKSDRSRGGIVRNVLYDDVCMRALSNPIQLNPNYDASATGSAIPTFESVTMRNVRHVSSSQAWDPPTVTINGFDASHLTGLTLDNVVVDGLVPANVKAQYANVTLGPGPVSFTPAGAGTTVTNHVSNSDPPNDCAGKFVTMPWAQ